MYTEEEYFDWHKKKVKINQLTSKPLFEEGQVWFCHLGLNIGFEQNGTGNDFLRPVIVLKKLGDFLFLGTPLTLSVKSRSHFYHSLFFRGKENIALLSQIRIFDSRRLGYFLDSISEKEREKIMQKVRRLLS